jgi:hypothetical protein
MNAEKEMLRNRGVNIDHMFPHLVSALNAPNSESLYLQLENRRLSICAGMKKSNISKYLIIAYVYYYIAS